MRPRAIFIYSTRQAQFTQTTQSAFVSKKKVKECKMHILCSKTAQTTFRFVTKSEKNRGNLKKNQW